MAAGSHGMASKQASARKGDAAVTTVVVMRLYIAGGAPNSVKAIANLSRSANST